MLRPLAMAVVMPLSAPPLVHARQTVLIHELSTVDLARRDLHNGSIADWLDVLGEPTLTSGDFRYLSHAPDPGDFDFRIWLAWHASPPRIYCAMERVDDVFINDSVPTCGGCPDCEYFGNDGTIHLLVDGNCFEGACKVPWARLAHLSCRASLLARGATVAAGWGTGRAAAGAIRPHARGAQPGGE